MSKPALCGTIKSVVPHEVIGYVVDIDIDGSDDSVEIVVPAIDIHKYPVSRRILLEMRPCPRNWGQE